MPNNMLTEQIDGFWFSRQRTIREACQALIDGDPYLMRMLLARRFEDGARWNFRETAAMSPHIGRFLEMCILLGPISETEENSSAYWHTPKPDETDCQTHRNVEASNPHKPS